MSRHDLIVVGGGIVGLAHALAAARRGKSVLVLERDAQANGASIRNFGFVTVTGQERGRVWELAYRSAAVWRDVAGPAGIDIVQQGLVLVARRAEAATLIDAFLETEMGRRCDPLGPAELAERWPMLREARSGLYSPHDLRVDSRTAIPRLAQWLGATLPVEIRYGVAVHAVDTGRVHSTAGLLEADAVIVCPGDEGAALYPDIFARAGVTRCKLQMLRLAVPSWRSAAPVMSDLSMVRYLGYAALPEAAALRVRLEQEAAVALAHGIHLIVVQAADGTLVVGDSHHYAATPDPFASAEVERAILDAYADVLGPPPPVLERWTGTYAAASSHHLIHPVADGVRLVVVTSGTGASTAFALAEDVIANLFGGGSA
jgi:FAD dependent oxidoreductase TIGR03364